MKIKEWVEAIQSLGHPNKIIGDVRLHGNTFYFDIVLAQNEIGSEFYYLPPITE